MFVRVRETARRLQVSLTATRWDGGRVRQEHVAGLGSVPLSPSAADRIAFWTKLHQRFDALSNRVGTTIHARIPRPAVREQDNRFRAEMVKRAERRTIKLVWDYLQILREGHSERDKRRGDA